MKPLPVPTLTAQQLESFWRKVDRRTEGECWRWLGACISTKYAKYGCFRVGERRVYPHRVAYSLLIGPIPDGLTLDHLADRCALRPLCVNPYHAEPVTQKENQRRHYANMKTRMDRVINRVRKARVCGLDWIPKECRAAHPGIPLLSGCSTCDAIMAALRSEVPA